MKEISTGIPIVSTDGDEVVRVEMFPELRKLADSRLICKFFEYLQSRDITVAAIDKNDQLVSLHEEVFRYLNIDSARLEAESQQIQALAAKKRTAKTEDRGTEIVS